VIAREVRQGEPTPLKAVGFQRKCRLRPWRWSRERSDRWTDSELEANRERQRRWRAEYKRNGLKEVHFWILPEGEPELKKLAREFECRARELLILRGEMQPTHSPNSGRRKRPLAASSPGVAWLRPA